MRYFCVILLFFFPLYVFSEYLNNKSPEDGAIPKNNSENNVEIEELNEIVGEIESNNNDDYNYGHDTTAEKAERKEAVENEVTDFGQLSLEEAFEKAVQAYLDDDFDNCIEGFHYVIKSYKKYRNTVTNCRTLCREETSNFTPIVKENIDDLQFYEKKIRETLCLLKCNQDYRDIAGRQALKRLPREVEWKIINRKPYEYLHICYYQRSRYQEAASAVFTYLVVHPKHEMSVNNLRYYLSLPEVNDKNIINLEAASFVEYYMKGVKAYEEEYYDEAIENIERSLKLYLKDENECRMYCEGPFDQGWHPEFTSSIANHFAYCLKCKRSCSQYLNMINGGYQYDLLASHYNYLQFAYYKMGDIKNTCQTVKSYLLFFPADETMLNNEEYYNNLPKALPDYFTPRPEAVFYIKRQEYELQILKYISIRFSAIDARLNEKKIFFEKRDSNFTLEDFEKSDFSPGPSYPLFSMPDTKILAEASNINSERESRILEALKNITILSREKELNGSFRYLAEGIMTEVECKFLVKLAKAAAVEGDGYENNKSPQSKYESFTGLTLNKVTLMVYFGLLKSQYLEVFIKSSEIARAHVERYFNLDQPLYFTYTHLVCRSALPDAPSDHDVLSHDIHADNCLAIKEDICLHQSPAYTWRNYSAIVYLNNDFDGGEFIFAADPKARKIQSTIQPKCGRMVAFSADEKNLHGVKGVKKGQRCALALWFTLDKKYAEEHRKLASVVLERVKIKGPVQVTNVSIPFSYEKLRQLLVIQFKEDYTLKVLMEIL